MNKNLITTTLALLIISSSASGQTLNPEDVQDFNSETGIGCNSEEPVTEKADFYFVCKSKVSGETAWNAALYRSKVACGKDKFSAFFNVPPSLPTENGIFGAQVEVSCSAKP